ncbi:MAG: hypothetical protein GX811_08930, partial [Lentisphaerae bacterium]|nr:hypothetical protein [Lentisphaerota bacterium]
MKDFFHSSHSVGKRGVALILVIGVMSLMTMMAVAFAVTMRIERMAAGNYSEIVRSRELIQVALTRALEHLEDELGSDLADEGLVFPRWHNGLIVSKVNTGSTNVQERSGPTLLFKNISTDYTEAAEYVPDSLWTHAHQAVMNTIDWIDVVTTNYTEVTLHGRIQYLILNTSGMLDMNHVGSHDGFVRGAGSNSVAEMSLSGLTFDFKDVNAFLRVRDETNEFRSGPYLTVSEAVELNKILQEPPQYLVTYSRNGPLAWERSKGIATHKINLAGTKTDLSAADRSQVIKDGFAKAGFTVAEAEIMYGALLNYVDTDLSSQPANMTYGTVPVPMINEIALSGIEDEDGDIQTIKLHVEVWNPFATSTHTSVWVRVNGNVPSWPAFFGTQKLNVKASPGEFAQVEFSMNLLNNKASFYTLQPGNLSISVCATDDEREYDRVDLAGVAGTVRSGLSFGLECIDPRLNATMSGWQKTTSATMTLGALNSCVEPALLQPGTDGDVSMYIARKPMQSIGELGYLFYGKPWTTVHLTGDYRKYGSSGLGILDVFGLDHKDSQSIYVTTNAVPGLVNPNTENDNVLAAVFRDMPVNQYPGEESINTVSDAESRQIANAVILAARMHSFTNLSDLGSVAANWGYPGGLSVVTNKLIKESFLRNSIELFSVAQNSFIVLIAAEVAALDGFAKYPTRQTAAATVWRN